MMCSASGRCTAWRNLGGIACGIFRFPGAGGHGWVSLLAQILGTLGGVAIALIGGLIVRCAQEVGRHPHERRGGVRGADLSIHKISANPEEDMTH